MLGKQRVWDSQPERISLVLLGVPDFLFFLVWGVVREGLSAGGTSFMVLGLSRVESRP